MTLDPQVKGLLEQMEAAGTPPLETFPPELAREAFQKMNQQETGQIEKVHCVEDGFIPGRAGEIPFRAYYPDKEGPHPVLVFFHGGGWVIGNIDSHDDICRTLTNTAGCAVVSIDYRLAPENKFPAAVEDCYAAVKYLYENAEEFQIDPSRIAVGGDSAGGNLTAIVCQLARKADTPRLVYQLLFYPATDFTADNESIRDNAQGYFLEKSSLVYFRDHYLNSPEDAKDPAASPLLAEDFSNLPPAMVITAEYDPLRDEGEAYAQKLKDAGVPVIQSRYEGMIHGFVSMSAELDKGKEALKEAGSALRDVFEK